MREDILRTSLPTLRAAQDWLGWTPISRLVVGATRIGVLAILATLSVSSSMVFARDVRLEVTLDISDRVLDRPTWQEERESFGGRLARSYGLDEAVAEEYAGWILEASTRQGFAPELLASLVMTESAFRKDARSSVGAIGPAQVQPVLWRDFCAVDLFDAEENLYCGAQILAHYQQICARKADSAADAQACALRSYNVGYRNHDNVYFAPAANRYVAKIQRYRDSLAET